MVASAGLVSLTRRVKVAKTKKISDILVRLHHCEEFFLFPGLRKVKICFGIAFKTFPTENVAAANNYLLVAFWGNHVASLANKNDAQMNAFFVREFSYFSEIKSRPAVFGLFQGFSPPLGDLRSNYIIPKK